MLLSIFLLLIFFPLLHRFDHLTVSMTGRVCTFLYPCVKKYQEIAHTSLTNKDKVKPFSVHKLRTQAFILVPNSSLYLLWY